MELEKLLTTLAHEVGEMKAEMQAQAAVVQALVMSHPSPDSLRKVWRGVQTVVATRSKVSELGRGSALEATLRERLDAWEKLFDRTP